MRTSRHSLALATLAGPLVLGGCTASRESIAAPSRGEVVRADLVDAGVPGGVGAPGGGRAPDTVKPPGSGPVQIVRYVGVNAASWPTAPAPHSYADFYTRIILASPDATGATAGTTDSPKRDYEAENRSWGARLLSSRTDTVTAVLNVTARDPGLTLAIPLFSVSHASGLKLGNTWNTVYTSSSVESPLFRIGPNTGLTVHVAAKMSSDLKSQGASIAVSAITTAVKIAAPTSTLLTTLSKSETTNAASAIDTALSSLLSEDISEDVEVGRLASTWTPGSALEFDGCSPFVRVDRTGFGSKICSKSADFGGAPDALVGTWKFELACPRLSVFDAADVCKQNGTALDDTLWGAGGTGLPAVRKRIASDVSDAQVLSFNLSSQTSVQAFVLAQPWFTSFVAMSTRQPSDYATFCSAGVVAMETSGLNSLDAALVVRAMIRQLPQLASMRDDFATGKAGAGCLPTLAASSVTLDGG